jgi:hypothetical protein
MPPPRRANEIRWYQNFVVNRTIGPLKERSMFLVLTVGALVKALVVTTVLSALKYSS